MSTIRYHWPHTSTHLNVESGIEAHLQESSLVLVEHTEEALLEDGCRERVRQDDDTIGRVWHGLHLEQSDLIQATGEQVDDVTVVRRPLCETLVELRGTQRLFHRVIMHTRTLDARLKCFALSRSMS